MTTRELIEALQQYRDAIAAKPEDDRTKREELIIETSTTLEELLRKYDAHGPAADPARQRVDDSALAVIRSYNEVNREHDLIDADIDLAAAVRRGRGNGTR